MAKTESLVSIKLILRDIDNYLEHSFMYLFVKFTVLMILGCLVVIFLFPQHDQNSSSCFLTANTWLLDTLCLLSTEEEAFGIICMVWTGLHIIYIVKSFGRCIKITFGAMWYGSKDM